MVRRHFLLPTRCPFSKDVVTANNNDDDENNRGGDKVSVYLNRSPSTLRREEASRIMMPPPPPPPMPVPITNNIPDDVDILRRHQHLLVPRHPTVSNLLPKSAFKKDHQGHDGGVQQEDERSKLEALGKSFSKNMILYYCEFAQ